jgi:aminoglycoside phosphotransferase (APT) family kinase protein
VLLGEGMTSRAWLVEGLVVRIVRPDVGWDANFALEARILAALHERGQPVPRPVAHGEHWAVTERVRGEPLGERALPARAARGLGRLLKALHALPAAGLPDARGRFEDPGMPLGTPAVPIHSDLHEEHLFLDGDELTGVIDFAEAFAGPPAWEFATLGYFLGRPAAERVRAAYADPPRWAEIEALEARFARYRGGQ